jgi:uncharacterized phage infection (PIP) family protein YhgE
MYVGLKFRGYVVVVVVVVVIIIIIIIIIIMNCYGFRTTWPCPVESQF